MRAQGQKKRFKILIKRKKKAQSDLILASRKSFNSFLFPFPFPFPFLTLQIEESQIKFIPFPSLPYLANRRTFPYLPYLLQTERIRLKFIVPQEKKNQVTWNGNDLMILFLPLLAVILFFWSVGIYTTIFLPTNAFHHWRVKEFVPVRSRYINHSTAQLVLGSVTTWESWVWNVVYLTFFYLFFLVSISISFLYSFLPHEIKKNHARTGLLFFCLRSWEWKWLVS